jgi:ribonuclease HI
MINVDAGFEETKGAGSTGAVIRDSMGGLVAASHSYISHVVDAAMPEAAALKDGLLLAQQIACSRVEFQSDCMEVVTTMQRGGFSATAAGAIYDECYQYWEDFHSISISHYSRDCNVVARELARQALIGKNSLVWIDEPPAFIRQLHVNDVTILSNE